MKSFKKMMAIVIAMVMMVSMSMSVFAANPVISSTTEGHTYKIFQIFTGDVDPENEQGLLDLKYGANTPTAANVGNAVSQDDIEALTDISATVINVDDVEDLAAIAQFVTIDDSKAYATVTKDSPATVPTGYYLIKDEDESQEGENDAYTLYLMKVVQGNYTITPKMDTPEVFKKVKDRNDSATAAANAAEEWQDSADYDIGDMVPYQITATLASNVTAYKVYEIEITDTLEGGLTPPAAEDVTVSGLPTAATGDTITPDVTVNGQVITIKVTITTTADYIQTADLNSCVIKADYEAELNEHAVIGKVGNANTIVMTFTNNPNDKQGGDKGETPTDTVRVFTYKTVVDKVDQDGAPLEGAGFSLYKVPATTAVPEGADAEAKNTAVAAIDGATLVETITLGEGDGNTFSFDGIDDGTYILCETRTPTGYNTMNPMLFTVNATHDDENDNPQLLTFTTTSPFTASKDGGDITTAKDNTHTAVSGEIYDEIVNQSGATLPETGGMGTTIFYIVGAVLVIGAGVLLVTRRRMSAQ